jgi:hypothetical protein
VREANTTTPPARGWVRIGLRAWGLLTAKCRRPSRNKRNARDPSLKTTSARAKSWVQAALRQRGIRRRESLGGSSRRWREKPADSSSLRRRQRSVSPVKSPGPHTTGFLEHRITGWALPAAILEKFYLVSNLREEHPVQSTLFHQWQRQLFERAVPRAWVAKSEHQKTTHCSCRSGIGGAPFRTCGSCGKQPTAQPALRYLLAILCVTR